MNSRLLLKLKNVTSGAKDSLILKSTFKKKRVVGLKVEKGLKFIVNRFCIKFIDFVCIGYVEVLRCYRFSCDI